MALAPANAQRPAEQSKTLVYNHVTEGASALDREAKNAYAGKFRFIDIRQRDGFAPGHIKGFGLDYRDPRPMRDEAVRGKVVVAWIVTPEGKVIEPRMLHSTDQRVAAYMINLITARRFVPARIRNVAVFSIWTDEFVFGSDPERADRYFKDGLGIQGQRDR